MSVTADQHFAIIPEWVLYADVSAQAIRLYATLRRYADKQGKAHPSRQTLADKIHVKSVRTVDAALDELEQIGALRTERRKEGREYLSSMYTVLSAPPSAADCATPSAASDPGLVQQAAHELKAIEPKPLERDSDFARFWTAYPMHKGRAEAEQAFAKALRDTAADVVIAGAERYARWLSAQDNPPATKYAQGWLNGRRWEDDLGPERGSIAEVTYYQAPPIDEDELAAFAAAAQANSWTRAKVTE